MIQWRAAAWFLTLLMMVVPSAAASDSGLEAPIRITAEAAGSMGGYRYELTYRVAVPVEIYWRFKTDFASKRLTAGEPILHQDQD